MSYCIHGPDPFGCTLCNPDLYRMQTTSYGTTNVTVSKPPEKGWQCPVCNAVWAPFVRRCEGCKP